jgi:hypothetical protein
MVVCDTLVRACLCVTRARALPLLSAAAWPEVETNSLWLYGGIDCNGHDQCQLATAGPHCQYKDGNVGAAGVPDWAADSWFDCNVRNSCSDRFWRYDMALNRWNEVSPPPGGAGPGPRCGAHATADGATGQTLLVGGWAGPADGACTPWPPPPAGGGGGGGGGAADDSGVAACETAPGLTESQCAAPGCCSFEANASRCVSAVAAGQPCEAAWTWPSWSGWRSLRCVRQA